MSTNTGEMARLDGSGMHEPSLHDHELNRRGFLSGLAAVASMAVVDLVAPSIARAEEGPLADPTRVPGALPSAYGKRSRFETATRASGFSHSLTPHQTLHGIITPSALHFERHHNGVPTIDPSAHRLLVHGLVARPLTFSMDDLLRFPSVTRIICIECSGNSAGEWTAPAGRTVQDTHGLMSTSEWTGVPLATILDQAGVQPDAVWMLAEGSDSAAMTRSLPLADMMSSALLCYGQNGEALRPEQGYPLRLIVPGWEGNTAIKWVRRLKLGPKPFMTREETSHYTDLLPEGKARQFSFVMEAKSVITSPSGGQVVQPGFVEIRGVAWSGRGLVRRVEISVDGGTSWADAQLQSPVLPYCHTRFRFAWQWNGEAAVLQSRCTDETGYRQPTRAALVAVRGVNSTYHYNAIQSWRVAPDGNVTNVHA